MNCCIILVVVIVRTFVFFFLDAETKARMTKARNGFMGLIGLTHFAWIICGTAWVFSKWSSVQFEDQDAGDYCDKHAFMVAFVLLIIFWLAFPFFLIWASWRAVKIGSFRPFLPLCAYNCIPETLCDCVDPQIR